VRAGAGPATTDSASLSGVVPRLPPLAQGSASDAENPDGVGVVAVCAPWGTSSVEAPNDSAKNQLLLKLRRVEEDAAPLAPRPAHGCSEDGRPDLKQVLLSLGVGGDGALPLRLGIRDGNTRESTETPGAMEACLALGLPGRIGIVADSTAYSQRTWGLCMEKKI